MTTATMPRKQLDEEARGIPDTSRPGPAEVRPNGSAVAAYLAAMIGLVVLGVVVFACEASKEFTQTVHAIGKLWMPGAEGIGPYSGKQTLMLAAWLGSWGILHTRLRKREMRGEVWLTVFLVGIGVASTLIWPPVWHFFLGEH